MSPGPTTASRLVRDGLADSRVVFGPGGARVSGLELGARGERLFDAAAGADAVGVLMTNDRPTVEVVIGALLAGARLVSLPPPGRGADLAEYAAFIAATRAAHGLAEVVVADEFAGLLGGIGVPARAHTALPDRPLATPHPDGFSLVQYTSGSTQQPRPVILDDARIGANIAALLQVLAPGPGHALVSWLPLSHDMGLIGMLLTAAAGAGPEWAAGGELVLLDPRAFLRRPGEWIEVLSRSNAAFTGAPDFAFRMAAERRAGPGLDLSSLRCAIVGGEIVRAETLDAFAAAYRDQGLDPRALCPAYGMAELAVAATMTPPEVPWQELSVSPLALADGGVRPAGGAEAPCRLVASGRALPGYEVAAGGDGETGQVAVLGPSLGVDGVTGRPLAGAGGWYQTGDAGFVDGDWLYVCGRLDDWVVSHGRNIYAPAVEAAVGALGGVRAGRVTAVGLPTGGWTILAEPDARGLLGPTEAAALRREIRRVAVDVAATRPEGVVIVAPGSLPLTASGKLQRNQARSRLLRGDLADLAGAAGAPVG
ncbi:MAG TPA: AMP-binding protein [Acidimicrobiales bacterium]